MSEIKLSETGLPYIGAEVYRTAAGTPYLKECGLAMIARPHTDLSGVKGFLDGFDADLGFGEYLDDPTDLPDAERLVKFMGQGCYLSFGPGRSMNADAAKYLTNIKRSGHGSVAEHANYSFWIWGIDRSVTHELVRHRAGFGFSQVSQRYVDGTKLRFVERPEYQWDVVSPLIADWPIDRAANLRIEVGRLHENFQRDIDRARGRYDERAIGLVSAREIGHPMLQGCTRTEARKQVNQVAREGLPNSTEAPIGVTANVRALRHACEMRANSAADVQIRAMAMKMLRCVRIVSPILFDDYRETSLPASGTEAIETDFRKV